MSQSHYDRVMFERETNPPREGLKRFAVEVRLIADARNKEAVEAVLVMLLGNQRHVPPLVSFQIEEMEIAEEIRGMKHD